MKYLKRAVALAAVIAVILGSFALLRYMVTDDAGSIRRLTIHEYNTQDSIDVLFIGASQVYNDIDTEVLDEKLGKKTFALGSASQKLDTTYYLLKDAVKRYHPEQVYVCISYKQARYTRDRYDDLTNVYVVTDYMKPSVDKYRYLLQVSEPDQYANDFLLAKRSWKTLFEPEKLAAILHTKATEEYRNYDYGLVTGANEFYTGKGHVVGKTVIEDGTLYTTEGYNPVHLENVTDTWREALTDIVDLCREQEVDLTFMIPPLSAGLLSATGNYDEFTEYVRELLSGTGVDYIDFSTMREDYWPDTETLFQDETHLNGDGAVLFSGILGDYLAGRITDEELFCSSVSERFGNLPAAFYGVTYENRKTGDEPMWKCRLIANRPEELEFKVEMYPEAGEMYEIQDFDKKLDFLLPHEEHGTLRVTVRKAGTEQVVTVACIDV